MGSTIIFENQQTQYTEFIVDTRSDLDHLREATVHDAALCLEDKKVYIKKESGAWEDI